MRYVLALDQGTTSSRAIVFDERGAARASAQKEFGQHFPQPGWVEHDCGEILRTQLACARAALKKAKLAPKRVAAIGITNQRETTVVWDRRTGKPVHRAIVWQDRRTAARCDALKREGRDQIVQAKTGLVIDPYFSATKIEWLLDNVAGLRARAEQGDLAFGTVDTWLAWQLSGGELHVTDPSNASRTMLYDIHRGEWDEELLGIFRVPRSMLPEVLPSSHIYGATAKGVPDSGGVYLVPAFTGLGAPHWDPYARGTIVGLTRGSNAGHIARAALESIAFQSADLLHAMEQDSGEKSKELRVDGGAAADNLLMQFQADLLGVPVVRPRVLETTALGAAYLAGLAVGVWKSREEIARQWKVAKRFEPRMKREEADRRMGEWRRALERAKNWQQFNR